MLVASLSEVEEGCVLTLLDGGEVGGDVMIGSSVVLIVLYCVGKNCVDGKTLRRRVGRFTLAIGTWIKR